jgi:hypothetical protein
MTTGSETLHGGERKAGQVSTELPGEVRSIRNGSGAYSVSGNVTALSRNVKLNLYPGLINQAVRHEDIYIYIYIQDVPGGMCQTSGACSLW